MLVSVPASSANLGPGFDTLAVALPKRLTVEVVESKRFELCSLNQGSEKKYTETELENHIVARVLQKVCGHTNFKVTVDSQIPLARGLGSSAALILGVAKAAGSSDPLGVAAEIEGHADNVAAAYFGGLIAVEYSHQTVNMTKLAIDPRLQFLLFIPEVELSTKMARDVLPSSYSRQVVAESLGRLAMMMTGLSDIDKFSSVAFGDLIHQPYRAKLFVEAQFVMDSMVDSGAIGAVVIRSVSQPKLKDTPTMLQRHILEA